MPVVLLKTVQLKTTLDKFRPHKALTHVILYHWSLKYSCQSMAVTGRTYYLLNNTDVLTNPTSLIHAQRDWELLGATTTLQLEILNTGFQTRDSNCRFKLLMKFWCIVKSCLANQKKTHLFSCVTKLSYRRCCAESTCSTFNFKSIRTKTIPSSLNMTIASICYKCINTVVWSSKAREFLFTWKCLSSTFVFFPTQRLRCNMRDVHRPLNLDVIWDFHQASGRHGYSLALR